MMDIHLNRMRSSRLEDHEQEIKLATGKVKAIHIRERGLTSTSWSEYSEEAVKRVQYSSSPSRVGVDREADEAPASAIR